jgi:DNA polymerase III subunit delta'
MIYSWHSRQWSALSANRAALPHALLISGQKGTGKFEFARTFAQSLLCEAPALSWEPCNACPPCGWFREGYHPDFRLLEPGAAVTEEAMPADSAADSAAKEKRPSSQIGIHQIRALAEFVNLTSHRAGYRIVLIRPAEAMNTYAANALLKTLEEPPPRVLFLLVSDAAGRLMPTIISRSRIVTMGLPGKQEAIAWLRQQGVTEAELNLALVGYAPLDALNNCAPERHAERHRLFAKLNDLRLNAVDAAAAIAESDIADTVAWLQTWCHDLIAVKLAGIGRYHLDLFDIQRRLVQGVELSKLLELERLLIEAKRLVNHPLSARLFVEHLLLSYRSYLFAR